MDDSYVERPRCSLFPLAAQNPNRAPFSPPRGRAPKVKGKNLALKKDKFGTTDKRVQGKYGELYPPGGIKTSARLRSRGV
jgi:hypothetical protein